MDSSHLLDASMLHVLESKVKRLNRICVKLGLEPIALSAEKTTYVHTAEDGTVYDRDGYNVTLNAPEITLSGWQFIAAIDHESGERNILRAKNDTPPIPPQYRDTESICEHCGTNRNRRDTYIVHNPDTGEWKQVGRTCLKDFTGHTSAASIASYYSTFHDIQDYLEECAGNAERGDGRSYQMVHFRDLMLCAAYFTRTEGFVSAKRAEEEYISSTKERVGKCILDKNEKLPEFSPADDRAAILTIRWARQIDANTDSDYLHNLRTIFEGRRFKLTMVSTRSLGLFVSAIAAWQRALSKAETAKRWANSNYVGAIGERLRNMALTVTRTHLTQGFYGDTTFVTFMDDAGNVFEWKASGLTGLEVGESLRVTGTVKDHAENKYMEDAKTTYLTRCKCEPAAQRETVIENHEAHYGLRLLSRY